MRTVYMLDDNSVELQMAERFLKKDYNLEFFGTTSPDALINWSDRCLPDFYIIDLMMPKKSGYEVIKELTSHCKGLKQSSIILFTGFDDVKSLDRIKKRFNVNIINKDSNNCYSDILNLIAEKQTVSI